MSKSKQQRTVEVQEVTDLAFLAACEANQDGSWLCGVKGQQGVDMIYATVADEATAVRYMQLRCQRNGVMPHRLGDQVGWWRRGSGYQPSIE